MTPCLTQLKRQERCSRAAITHRSYQAKASSAECLEGYRLELRVQVDLFSIRHGQTERSCASPSCETEEPGHAIYDKDLAEKPTESACDLIHLMAINCNSFCCSECLRGLAVATRAAVERKLVDMFRLRISSSALESKVQCESGDKAEFSVPILFR